ncbi:MAG: glycosyltransferase family 2 protein [Solirubrobacterales bacterium]|nr:glycosyltransferase family 2 protein [Solirubrobacterales bacterium]MBV9685415.1 glycosyltransferase family 2 protein [Solirubrobacterales bacterium]MBV9808038.1 glycosyltransferase family 2 protein [Solirubrobacterales bacterium]
MAIGDPAPIRRQRVSAIILTHNEAALIERCVQSARFADEIVVVDCGSDDETCALAERAGATVIHQDWLGWSAQRNRGAEAAANDWVMVIEADEIITAELEVSLQRVLSGPMDPRDGYTVDRRGDFLGVLLPNETRRLKQRTFVRLYNRLNSRYDIEQLVHEEVTVPGRMIALDGVLLHWRGQTFGEIVSVFNRYATTEAEMLDRAGVQAKPERILARTIGRFLWVYVWKGAFRVGVRGLLYALLKANSETLQYGKLWERQHVPRPTIHPPPHLTGRSDLPTESATAATKAAGEATAAPARPPRD